METKSNNLLAQIDMGGTIGSIRDQEPISNWPFQNLGEFISNLVIIAMLVAGVAFFAFLIYSGIQYITSSGDKTQLESARNRITYALVGLVIVVGAYAIIRLLEAFFGLTITGTIQFPTP